MQRQVRQLSVVVALALLGGCQKEQPAGAPGPQAASRGPATDTGGPRTGREFKVGAAVEGPVTAGGGGALVARVEAGEGFYINAEYPVSFRPDKSSDGVRFAQERFALQESAERTPCPGAVAHAGAAPNACTLSARVPFSATAAGPQRVAGVLAFSVCNPERCLIDKVPLEVTVEVR